MKWIFGALILAVVASVMSGRVPASWVIYCFAFLFASMAAALVFAFVRTKHYGLLLLGIVYFASALAAVVIFEWWPLIVGFGLAWVLRMMGIEPAPEDLPGAQVEAPNAEGEKKN